MSAESLHPEPVAQVEPAEAGNAVALSLISHTNAGKTTLARTLLGRDVGEVRDEAHVTQEALTRARIVAAGGAFLNDGDRVRVESPPATAPDHEGQVPSASAGQ